MIAPEIVEEVRRLLAQSQHGQRRIARMLGISRGTVGAIATGKRPDHEARRRKREAEGLPQPAGPPRRCPGCGGMVYLPCRACAVRKAAAESSRPPAFRRFPQLDEPLGLDLRDADQKRYQRVRAERIRAELEKCPAELLDPTDDPPFDDEAYELDLADLRDALEFDEADELDELNELVPPGLSEVDVPC